MPANAVPRADVAIRLAPWILRALWVGVAIAGGAAVDDALAERSDIVRQIGTIGSSAVWLVGVAAMAIPAVVTLTAVRVVVPLALPVALLAVVGGVGSVSGASFLGLAVLTTVVAMSADLGQAFVQASAYGDESRFLLRPPLGFAVMAAGTWCLWAAAVVGAPLLLAARAWIVGAVVAAAAVALSALLPRRWHRLSLRWLVMVPAGLVLHDPVVLAETLMLRRNQVGRLQLALAGTGAADLTGPATGHAVEVTVNEMVTAILAPTPGEPRGKAIHLSAYLAGPTRPGRVLRHAAERRLPVG